jgi:hypothetical protein
VELPRHRGRSLLSPLRERADENYPSFDQQSEPEGLNDLELPHADAFDIGESSRYRSISPSVLNSAPSRHITTAATLRGGEARRRPRRYAEMRRTDTTVPSDEDNAADNDNIENNESSSGDQHDDADDKAPSKRSTVAHKSRKIAASHVEL